MTGRLNGLDLFSGIGGNTLALRQYVRTVAYCEADRHAQSVLLSRMEDGSIERAPIWDDIRTLTGNHIDVPIDVVVGGFPCFVAGTHIQTRRGCVPIETVVVGDEVLTHLRRWRRVNQVHRTEDREIRFVDGTGMLPTETTDEHPYFTRTRVRTWNRVSRTSDVSWSVPKFTAARDIKGLHTGLTFPSEVMDDNRDCDYWWLVGRCLADGWCVKRKNRGDGGYARVVVCCGKHRRLDDEVGRVFNYSLVEDKTAYKYHIVNKAFAREFAKAGIGAANKQIPVEWLCLPKEKLAALLRGYFSGDGSYVEKSKTTRATTVSQALALTLQMAILKCYGKVPSLWYCRTRDKTQIEGRIVNTRNQFQIAYRDSKPGSSYVDSSGEYGWGVCRRSEKRPERATVFNIGVEEDESYIANGAIVHNCQDISVAGNGAGLDGERSGLVFQIFRLISEVKPAFVFMENVPAIRTRGGERVVKELARLGYDCRWDCLSAYDVGAPHKRERWFLLGSNVSALAHPQCPEWGSVNPSGRDLGRQDDRLQQGRQEAPGGTSVGGTDVADTDKERWRRGAGPQSVKDGWGQSTDSGWWSVEPNVGRMANGVPLRVDRLKRLGNAVVPQQAREAFERLIGLKLKT